MIVETSSGGVPRWSLAVDGALPRPSGKSPLRPRAKQNMGLPMSAVAYDIDHDGHLVALSPSTIFHGDPPAPMERRAPLPAPLAQPPRPDDLRLDRARDALLTPFGKATLTDRYLLPGESFQDLFARVACAYADDLAHAQRLYDAMSRLWFMPATPVLSNGGTTRGLPISCFLNTVPDSLEGIVATWNENVWLASNGGGIGTYWGRVRSIGETVKGCGETSGIIPFIHVMDGLTLAISQGSLRRGSAACYLDIDHPEIEEFLEIRKASGDFNRKGLNLHHGINVTDAFMEAVRAGAMFPLKSPKTGETIREVNARQLWQRILETRLHTGEPYLLFIDTVNRALPKHARELGLKVSSSNLCSEIVLPTGRDHRDQERTAVCCLASLNLETWDQWHGDERFIDIQYEDLTGDEMSVMRSVFERLGQPMRPEDVAAMEQHMIDNKRDRLILGYSYDCRIEADADGQRLLRVGVGSPMRRLRRRFSPARKFHVHLESSPCSP